MARYVAGRSRRGGFRLVVAGALIVGSGQIAWCQAGTVQPSAAPAVALSSSEQVPAYEVATIKPQQGNEFAPPLRGYIQGAFGIPVMSNGWVIGPDWINSVKYVIRAKPADAVSEAMKTMTREQRAKVLQQMQQGLLADRFKLKAHFETREMPIYELVIAKGGPKLKENPDASKGRASMGASSIRGTAVPVHVMLGFLEGQPDVGGRVVVDKTGLAGTYDFLLKWTPMDAAPSADTESVSFFTALEEQLGLKLVPAKEQGQVLVIDHIERPSEN